MADQTYTRVDIATKQLELALWFFLERQNFSSALKHARAAEETFRTALSPQQVAQLAETPMMSASGPFETRDDLEDAATWAIVRACDSSNRLGLPRTARMLEFDDWFYKNVVGYEEGIYA